MSRAKASDPREIGKAFLRSGSQWQNLLLVQVKRLMNSGMCAETSNFSFILPDLLPETTHVQMPPTETS